MTDVLPPNSHPELNPEQRDQYRKILQPLDMELAVDAARGITNSERRRPQLIKEITDLAADLVLIKKQTEFSAQQATLIQLEEGDESVAGWFINSGSHAAPSLQLTVDGRLVYFDAAGTKRLVEADLEHMSYADLRFIHQLLKEDLEMEALRQSPEE